MIGQKPVCMLRGRTLPPPPINQVKQTAENNYLWIFVSEISTTSVSMLPINN